MQDCIGPAADPGSPPGLDRGRRRFGSEAAASAGPQELREYLKAEEGILRNTLFGKQLEPDSLCR